MAHQQSSSSFFNNIGQKVQTGIHIASVAKNIWGTGKILYAGFNAVSPYLQGMIATAAVL